MKPEKECLCSNCKIKYDKKEGFCLDYLEAYKKGNTVVQCNLFKKAKRR